MKAEAPPIRSCTFPRCGFLPVVVVVSCLPLFEAHAHSPALFAASESEPQTRPNVVLILADDLGFGDVGVMNPASAIATPNIDSLAGEGMRFLDAHSPASICTPTRYALLTGRYAWRTSLKSGGLNGYSSPLVEQDRPTLASLLRGQGYRTAIVGKWHLGMEMRRLIPKPVNRLKGDPGIDFGAAIRHAPIDRGFDEYFGVSASLDYPPYVNIRNDRFVATPTIQQQKRESPRYTRRGPRAEGFEFPDVLDKLVEEAVAFIERSSDDGKPFFLYFSLTSPHMPLTPHSRFRGTTGLGEYGDFVAQVDDVVGSVLEALDRGSVRDETLVIFTSDNGSQMRRVDDTEPDHVVDSSIPAYRTGRHQSNASWRGTKTDIWEGGHRVPFLVRWPGVVGEGTTSAATIVQNDLFATFAEIVDIVPGRNSAEDSVSLLPILRGDSMSRGVPVVHHSLHGMYAIRDGDWKLVAGSGSGGREKPQGYPFARPYKLFNLSEDPSETSDLTADHSNVARRLERKLRRFRSSGRSVPMRGNGSPEALGRVADRTLAATVHGVAIRVSRVLRDPDGDALTYVAESSQPSVATVSMSGSVVTIAAVSEGETTVTVRATDTTGSNRSAMQSFDVLVPNRAPVAVATLPDRELRIEDGWVTEDVDGTFLDGEGDLLSYGAESSDSLVAKVSVSGSVLSLAPLKAGQATVTVTASDVGGSNHSESQRFEVTVLNRPPQPVGSLAELTLRVGEGAVAAEVADVFRDEDGDELTFGAESSDPAVASVSFSASRVTVNPLAEGRATLTVTATDVAGTNMSARQSFVVTVLPARGVALDRTTLSLSEGDTERYRVVLDSEPTGDVEVTMQASLSDTDLTVDRTSLTFGRDNWNVAQEIEVTASEDTDAVADKPVVLRHSVNGADYGSVAAPAVVVTILENDTPAVSVDGARAVEGAGSMAFEVDLSVASSSEVTVDYATSDQTGRHGAAAGFDYGETEGRLAFPAGSTGTQRILVPILDDSEDEEEEEFLELTLSNPKGALLAGGDGSLTVVGTIEDNDDPDVDISFDAPRYEVAEGESVGVMVRLSAAPERLVEVPLVPTARAGSMMADYSGIPPILSFSAVETERMFRFSATDDTDDDDGEEVGLSFGPLPPGVNGDDQVTLSIRDDDSPQVTASFDAPYYEVTEGESVAVTMRLSVAPERQLRIPLNRAHHSGASPGDYSGVPDAATFGIDERESVVVLNALSDAENETPEWLTLSFGELPLRVTGGPETTLTILDRESGDLGGSGTPGGEGGETDEDAGNGGGGGGGGALPEDGDGEDDDDEGDDTGVGGDTGGGAPPRAAIAVDVECSEGLCRARTGVPVRFEDASTGLVRFRRWEFGDGAGRSGRTVEHAWSTPGFYEVALWTSNGRDESAASRVFLVEASDPAGTCVSTAETLCLQDARYSVGVEWWTGDDESGAGTVAHAGTNDSGLFWFFDLANWEVLVKVLDGCALNGHVWVYGASSTTLGYSIRVTDTATGVSREYRNESGRPAAAMTDSTAFAQGCHGG